MRHVKVIQIALIAVNVWMVHLTDSVVRMSVVSMNFAGDANTGRVINCFRSHDENLDSFLMID